MKKSTKPYISSPATRYSTNQILTSEKKETEYYYTLQRLTVELLYLYIVKANKKKGQGKTSHYFPQLLPLYIWSYVLNSYSSFPKRKN